MLYDFTIPQMTKMLHNLGRILENAAQFAEVKKLDVDVLPNSRLAVDQFALIRQVQVACDSAKLGASRLTGKDAPKHEDGEKTIPELRARIESTIGYLNSLSPKDFSGAETKRVTSPRWEGKTLSGLEFAIQHMLPNVYFHITTAYAILRHNGVEIGKKDYLGEMPYQK